jgi:mutator protein MutT
MEIKKVVVGIVRRDEAYLVGRRAAHQTLAGYAEFPGGKLLPGEAPEDGVKREVREETGLEIEVTAWRREVRHAYAQGELQITFFLCTPIGAGPPLPPFRWVPRAELGRLKFPDANAAIFAELFPELMPKK